MKHAVIQGIGIISKLGNSESQILNNLEKNLFLPESKLMFDDVLDPRKARRMNRIARMLTTIIYYCIKDSNQAERIDYIKTGLIVNVGYGPIDTVLRFGENVVHEKPELVSPTDFANTVYNAVIGHAAMYYGLKGPSTLLMGSNSILYTMKLLDKNAANDIFVCGVEEYCEPTIEYTKEKYGETLFCEGAAALHLSGQGTSQYGYILSGVELGLGYAPLFSECQDETQKFKILMERALCNSKVDAGEIDCVFYGTDKLSGLRNYEEIAVSDIFDERVQRVYVKDHILETIGASMAISIAIAAMYIKAGKYNKILVCGVEISGTLEAFVLSREKGTYDV